MASAGGSALRGGRSDRSWLAPLMVTAGGLAFGLFAMNNLPIGVVNDDGRYLVLARAIATGQGFHVTTLPGAPASTHFPPGFPLLLAVIWRFAPEFPANVALFKLLNVVLLSCAALATYAFARLRGGLERPVAVAVALAFAGTVPVLFVDGELFSEPFFTAAMLAALLLAERAAAPPTPAAGSPRAHIDLLALAAGLAAGGVTMIRSLGIVVVVGLFLVLLLRRRWRAAFLALAGACVFIGPWEWWTLQHAQEIPGVMTTHYGTYGRWMAPLLQRDGYLVLVRVVAMNLRGLGIILTLFGAGAAAPVFGALVAASLLVAFAIGVGALLKRAPVTVLAGAVYVAMMLLWPWEPDRYLWPMWPIILTAMVCGVVQVARWPAVTGVRRAARRTMLASFAACGALFIGWQATAYRSRVWEELARGNARRAVAMSELATRLPPGLIASEFDALIFLYTGRAAVPIRPAKAEDYLHPPSAADAARDLVELLDTYHPAFVLITTEETRAAAELLTAGPSRRLRFAGVSPEGVLIYLPLAS